MPFKLTPQFTNLLLSLDSIALLCNDMVHTLPASHLNREIISAVLDAIIMKLWTIGWLEKWGSIFELVTFNLVMLSRVTYILVSVTISFKS